MEKRFVSLLLFGVATSLFSASVVAQDGDGGIAGDRMTWEGNIKVVGVPDATLIERLPTQLIDGGHLMALHVASVLEWVCNDASLRLVEGKIGAGCYRILSPSIPDCTAKLQEQVPIYGRKPYGRRLELLEFRQQLRTCILDSYVAMESAAGRQIVLPVTMGSDPFAKKVAR